MFGASRGRDFGTRFKVMDLLSGSTSRRERGLTWVLKVLGVSLCSLHALSKSVCCLKGKVNLGKQLASDSLVIHTTGQSITQHLREPVSKIYNAMPAYVELQHTRQYAFLLKASVKVLALHDLGWFCVVMILEQL